MMPKLEAWNTAMGIFVKKDIKQLSQIFVMLGKPVYTNENQKLIIRALNLVYMKKIRDCRRLGNLEERLK